MGLFWKPITNTYLPRHAVLLHEPEGTISRKWPIIWRFGQYRYLLDVPQCDEEHGYMLYSYSDTQGTRFYQDLIHTRYILVYAGPEPVYYWPESRLHKQMDIQYTNVTFAGPLVAPPANKILRRRLSRSERFHTTFI